MKAILGYIARNKTTFTWDEMAQGIRREFNENRSGDAWRRVWKRNKHQLQEVTPETLSMTTKGNILVIGDTHLPFTHKHYLNFCQRVRDKHGCETIVHIGDLVDNHAMSFHDTDPDGYSAGKEHELAQKALRDWTQAFPTVYGLLGNHDLIPQRQALAHGLSQNFIKSFEAAWGLPVGWRWYMELEINGVVYTHGTGNGGNTPALNRAIGYMQPVVSGHIHTAGGANWRHGRNQSVWGLNVGCGIDAKSYAMAYGRNNTQGYALGCGVVLAGNIPLFVPMV